MRQKFLFNSFLVAVIFFTGFLLSSCSEKEKEGKISVTTMSAEAKAEFTKGRELFEKLRQRESLVHFENAYTKDNQFALAYYYHSLANPTAKGFFNDLESAVGSADKVSEGERLIILALKAGVDGNQKLQEEHLTKLVSLFPDDERAHGQLGQFYFGQQKYDLAIKHLKKSTEIAPDYSLSYNMLGYSYRNLGNFDEAEKSFKKYIELIPDDPNPYDSYAEMLLKQGRYDESILQYKKALEINPDFFASRMGISNNLIFQKKYDEAKENCLNSFNLAKNDGERRFALFTMTIAHVDEGDIEGAMEQMQKQFEIAKAINDAGAMSGDLNTMGNIMYEAELYDNAREKFKEAVTVMMGSDLSEEVKGNTKRLAIYNEARLHLKTGKLEDAKKLAEEFSNKATSANNTFQIWLSHYLNGLIALKEKNYQTAINEFQKANMQNPQTYYQLAVSYQRDGNIEQAKNYARQCANFNALTSLNQAFVRNDAQQMLTSL